jgi:hypothetical protein
MSANIKTWRDLAQAASMGVLLSRYAALRDAIIASELSGHFYPKSYCVAGVLRSELRSRGIVL